MLNIKFTTSGCKLNYLAFIHFPKQVLLLLLIKECDDNIFSQLEKFISIFYPEKKISLLSIDCSNRIMIGLIGKEKN